MVRSLCPPPETMKSHFSVFREDSFKSNSRLLSRKKDFPSGAAIPPFPLPPESLTLTSCGFFATAWVLMETL